MNAKSIRSLEAYVTVVTFLKRHKISGGRFTTAIATLEDCISKIRTAATIQLTARDGPTLDSGTRQELRAEIRQDYMIPIAREGRAFFRDEPKMLHILKVPHANDNDAEVVAAAEAMVKAIRPYIKFFHGVGHNKGILTALAKAAKRLKRWTAQTRETASRRVAANRELDAQLARARDTVRVIDGLMLGYCRKNPTLTKTWKMSRKIAKKRGRPRARKRAPVEASAADLA